MSSISSACSSFDLSGTARVEHRRYASNTLAATITSPTTTPVMTARKRTMTVDSPFTDVVGAEVVGVGVGDAVGNAHSHE